MINTHLEVGLALASFYLTLASVTMLMFDDGFAGFQKMW